METIDDLCARLRAARRYSVPGVWDFSRFMLEPTNVLDPNWWYRHLYHVARQRGIRLRDKRGPSQWTEATTALGNSIRLAKGFWNRPVLSKALTLVHELNHCAWQRSFSNRFPVARWIAKWARDPDFRWLTEAAAECDEFWLYGLLTQTADTSIDPQAARATQSIFRYYRLPPHPAKEKATSRCISEAIRAGRTQRARLLSRASR